MIMDELWKDKIFWTQEKCREKEVEPEKSDSDFGQTINIKEIRVPDSQTTGLEDEEADKLSEGKPEEVDAFKSIENKVIGLYFAADWCIPCQEFTFLLKQTYEELKERISPFEIVFVSFDKKIDDMKTFFSEKHGDWLSVPYKDPLVDVLKSKYEIKAIPKLIIIRDNGTIITEKGRKDIQDKGIICFRGWLQKANLSATKPSEKTLDSEKQDETKLVENSIEKEKTVSFKENVSSITIE
ncbi:nucleoredoxin-like protein 2 [Mytilus edulis]|uniref:nucleoredoxin-like protein 2 n=1 Tax=Mytilus edulis TaxID=6550 RepID=UPI0039F0DC26